MREIKNKEAFDSFTDNWEDNQPEHYYILEDGWSACEDFYEPIIKDLQARIAELEKEKCNFEQCPTVNNYKIELNINKNLKCQLQEAVEIIKVMGMGEECIGCEKEDVECHACLTKKIKQFLIKRKENKQ